MAQAALQAGAEDQHSRDHHHVCICHGADLLPLGPYFKDPAAGPEALRHVSSPPAHHHTTKTLLLCMQHSPVCVSLCW